MKAILQSNAYQRSSRPLAGNRGEHRFYSRYYPRRMMAEVLHDAIVQVTEVPTKFEWLAGQGGERQKTDFYPPGTRAIQLYDSAVESYFLQAFGRNPRRIVCECERSEEPTVVQVLHISNGNTLNEKLKAPGNRVEQADQPPAPGHVRRRAGGRALPRLPGPLSDGSRARPAARDAAPAGLARRARDRRGCRSGAC